MPQKTIEDSSSIKMNWSNSISMREKKHKVLVFPPFSIIILCNNENEIKEKFHTFEQSNEAKRMQYALSIKNNVPFEMKIWPFF